jgi:glycerol transport system ATP-binding protein
MSLRLDGVSRVVGNEVWIDTLTLDLAAGQLYVLLGPTRAGKTSLMRLIAGLDRPTVGRVLVDGVDVTGQSVRKRSVAMVYQQFINYPTLTAYDNIASPLRLQGMAAAEVDRQVRETAKLLHIEHLLDRLPMELSGGQQQRLAIARALVKRASLLLLDEPLVNLDYKLREELRAELRDLFARQRTTVVYATTEPLEALIMGGEVIVMDEGRVLQTGATIQVYHQPGSLRVAAVYSDPPMNTLSVTVEEGVARGRSGFAIPLTGHLGVLAAGQHTLGVRANHLSIRRRHEAELAVDATVELAEISGSETFIHVRNGDLHWVVQEEGVHEYGLHQPIQVYLDPARLYAFDRGGTLEAMPANVTGRG